MRNTRECGNYGLFKRVVTGVNLARILLNQNGADFDAARIARTTLLTTRLRPVHLPASTCASRSAGQSASTAVQSFLTLS